ncbi:MAG TPA: patatin-like phospholipase family protein [Atribacterota bacterium]|nr:patatin-like phospholipase family protein [Atribacterota bacterium]
MKKTRFYIFLIILIIFFYANSFIFASARNEPKIGLALGGGGPRGFAHLGVLNVLEREGIKIDYIAGTSVGSLVGAFYALGFDLKSIEDYILEENFTKYISFKDVTFELEEDKDSKKIGISFNLPKIITNPSWPRGLFSTTAIRDKFDELSHWAHFEYDVKIPFKAVATDLITGEKIIIDSGKVSNAIAASISIPGVFYPFEYDGRILVDGALKDPVPVDVVREMGADIVIAVSLQDITGEKKDPNNVISIIERSVDIMIEDLTNLALRDADLVLKPQYQGEVSYFLKKKERLAIIREGEIEAEKKINELKKMIADFQ